VFANDEARRFARRGLRHAAVLEDNRRLPLEIQLHRCRIVARRPSDVDSAVKTLLELAERALDLGYADDARAAYRLVSVLRWEAGRFAEAELASARIETIGRAGTLSERARAMGESGQCLALLERDLPKAEALLLEARALATKGSLVLFGVSAGLGVLARYRDRRPGARRTRRRGAQGARREAARRQRTSLRARPERRGPLRAR
jgi:hypothetical protein